MADCLLLLTEQLMTACDLNAQFDHRKLDHGTEKLLSGFYPVTEQDVIVSFMQTLT